MNQIPTVNIKEAENFSKVWNYNGVAILLNEIHLRFAADFANVVLASFVRDCQVKALAAQKAAQQSKIIMEE